MNVYAYLSIAEAAFKLGIAYILFSIPSERLIVYGLLSLCCNGDSQNQYHYLYIQEV